MTTGQARDKRRSPEQLEEAFRQEVADVFCQTLLLARFHGIDVMGAVHDKWLAWAEPGIDS
jgi:NTP pyrophosphatase (non-canonical NTP hydrolase)